MSDAWGGYGTGVDQNVLAQLLPYIIGSLSDQKGVLGVQQSGLNNLQDIVKLIFDPQFGMLTGTYDPMLSVDTQGQQQQGLLLPTPMLDAAARSGDPTVAQVASMIKSGEIADPMVAAKTLTEKSMDSSSALFGMTADQIQSQVQDWFGELSDQQITLAKTQYDAANSGSGGSSKPKDVWAAAGLPNPTEQYYAAFDPQSGMLDTNAPLSAGVAGGVRAAQDRVAMMQKAYKDYLDRNPGYRDPSTRRRNADQSPVLADASAAAAKKVANDQLGISLEELPAFLEKNKLGGKNWAVQFDMGKLRAAAAANGGLVPWEFLGDVGSKGPLSNFAQNTASVRQRIFTGMDGWRKDWTSSRMAQNKTAAEWSGRGAQEALRNSAGPAQDGIGDSRWVDLQNALQGQQFAGGRAMGEALAMQASGRNPTQDAVNRKLAMLRAAGLF